VGARGAELVVIDLDGDFLDIATNDAPPDLELQRTKPL
jgi:hypothetical protein